MKYIDKAEILINSARVIQEINSFNPIDVIGGNIYAYAPRVKLLLFSPVVIQFSTEFLLYSNLTSYVNVI